MTPTTSPSPTPRSPFRPSAAASGPAARRRRPRRPSRWTGRASALLALSTLTLVLLGSTGVDAQATDPGSAGAGDPAGGDEAPSSERIACLDARLRPATDCPAVAIAVTLGVDDDVLTVTVANSSKTTWTGGPLAVELPVPGTEVDEPTGTLDEGAVGGGGAEWLTRAGVVVGRCAYEPVVELAAEAELTCRLPRLGLPDGDHELWFTGFVGGLPPATGVLGDDAPAVGVVPVATSRSVRFRLAGDEVSVVTSPPAEGPAAPEEDDGADRSAAATAAPFVVVAVVLAVGGWWTWGRRRRPA